MLDLGSGGGIDVLLSARRVGPTGKAYGLDMTDEMLALANENKRRAGAENVEFLRGEIERIPLPDESVDVIISNCVINLVGRQEESSGGSLPRPQAWWAVRCLRCRRPWRGAEQRAARWSCGSAAWPARSRSSSFLTCSEAPGSTTRPSSPPGSTSRRCRGVSGRDRPGRGHASRVKDRRQVDGAFVRAPEAGGQLLRPRVLHLSKEKGS